MSSSAALTTRPSRCRRLRQPRANHGHHTFEGDAPFDVSALLLPRDAIPTRRPRLENLDFLICQARAVSQSSKQ
jgi:hypothetical protein